MRNRQPTTQSNQMNHTNQSKQSNLLNHPIQINPSNQPKPILSNPRFVSTANNYPTSPNSHLQSFQPITPQPKTKTFQILSPTNSNTNIAYRSVLTSQRKLQETSHNTNNTVAINSCRSFPHLSFNNMHSYIKLDLEKLQQDRIDKQQILNRISTSLDRKKRLGNKSRDVPRRQQLRQNTKKQEIERLEDCKKPKFIRRNTVKIEKQPGQISNNGNDTLMRNYTELVYQNSLLKKKLLQAQQKIQALNMKIQNYNPKKHLQKIKMLENKLIDSTHKNTQISLKLTQTSLKLTQKSKQLQKLHINLQQLSTKLIQSQQNNVSLSSKLQQILIQQQQLKLTNKTNSLQLQNLQLNLNLNQQQQNNNLILDMISKTQYIDSLTDLQNQLHIKKTEIFTLTQFIQQLKIKQHFIQLRAEENVKRVSQQWSTKYKRLLSMYKALKNAQDTSNNISYSKYNKNTNNYNNNSNNNTNTTINNSNNSNNSNNNINNNSNNIYSNNNNRDIHHDMKKQKLKTQYMQQQKQDIFNLSLSTDRSQLLYQF